MQTSRTLEARTLSVASVYMRHVYTWMTAGLGVTSVVALAVAGSPALQQMIFSNFIVMIALIVAQFGIVIALSAAVHKMSATMATGMFMLYSVLTGLTLSSIFIVYPIGAIANAFITAAGMFLAMSIYGTVTKRDLSGMGNFLFMGLIGIIIASIVNIFLGSSMMDFVISVYQPLPHAPAPLWWQQQRLEINRIAHSTNVEQNVTPSEASIYQTQHTSDTL